MQTLLNLLAGVSLLVWGTHIIRTGILRLYGGDLRRVLRNSVAHRATAFLAGLGVTGLRRWVSIMLMAGLDHKPRELLVTAIVRARMCEILARNHGVDADSMFTVGLFQ